MPETKKMKQQTLESSSKDLHGRIAARKSRKKAGTRVGVLSDWRAAGAKVTGKKSVAGMQLRDGR